MWLFNAIIFAIALSFSLGISVLISQPFTGALVRLRANYLPKAVSLDNVLEDGGMSSETGGTEEEEEEAQQDTPIGNSRNDNGVTPRKISAYFLNQKRQSAKIGPVVSGVFPMLFRTKKLEGWAGVYKGSIPVALQLLFLALITGLLFNVDRQTSFPSSGGYKAAPTGPDQFGFIGNLFFMIFFALTSLPLNVITYRAIVHPTILPAGIKDLRANLEELLSPAEIAQPWRLYLIPGLLPATFAHIAWVGLLTRFIRYILVPNLGGLADPEPALPGDTTYSGPNSDTKEVNPVFLALFLGWSALSVIALSPLEVVSVRLATQRPERQQPLHLAYSRVNNNDNAPASYSHQSTVARNGNGNGNGNAGFSDNVQARNDKSLPQEPESTATDETPGRPSFAIEDEDDDQQPPRENTNGTGQGQGQNADPLSNSTPPPAQTSTPAPTAESIPDPSSPFRSPHPARRFGEPSEPVIALRPSEEYSSSQQSQEETVARYEGLRDCLDKIVDEEGVEALYRGAWVTGLGSLLGGLN
ncbi:unnamed protein product [Sympodiomycopsis kandeliae]